MTRTLLALFALTAMSAFPAEIHGSLHNQPGSTHVKPKLVNGTFNADTIFAQIADGGGWTTMITIVNLSRTESAVFTIEFVSNSGAEQAFTWSGPDIPYGAYSVIHGSLTAGGEIELQTANVGTSDGTGEGYAELVSTTDQYSTSPNVSGYAVFRSANGNEATVPLEDWRSSNQLIAWNQQDGYAMGVAAVNTNDFSITLTAYLYDGAGDLLGSFPSGLQLCARCHLAVDFTGIFPLNLTGLRGTLFVEPSASGLVLLGLQYTPSGGFTSIHSLESQ